MYKKGDIVKIVENLEEVADKSKVGLATSMLEYISKTAIITEAYEGFKYRIDLDSSSFAWTAEMFESAKPKLFKLL